MTRDAIVCLLVSMLASPTASAMAATLSDDGASPWVDATFIALDAANARVTYRLAGSDRLTTSPVSSPATVEKLAKISGGKKVVLQCRVTQPEGEVTVDDAKKKANWLKRGILLGLVVGAVAIAATAATNPEI